MANVIQLEVVTPEGLAVKAEVDQVDAPSVSGEFGILPGHRPMLAALKPGVVRFQSAGRRSFYAIGPGFAEAGPEAMTILTDAAIDGATVDVASTRLRRDEAQRAIDGYAGEQSGPEFELLLRNRDWFEAQIEAAREAGRN